MACKYTYDDCFVAGDTYRLVAVLKDSAGVAIDITNYAVKMQMRTSLKSATAVIEKTKTVPADEGVEGLILIVLSAVETAALNTDQTVVTYVYDIELTDPIEGEVQTILGGSLTVSLGVTR